MARLKLDVWLGLLTLLGLGSLLNGLWMLADAAGWFASVAADVTPFNVHLVRDVGAAYLAAGVALLWAALRVEWRGPLVAVATVFHGLHALGHVRETWSGELASAHWWADLPGVYLPALILLGMAVVLLRGGPRGPSSAD